MKKITLLILITFCFASLEIYSLSQPLTFDLTQPTNSQSSRSSGPGSGGSGGGGGSTGMCKYFIDRECIEAFYSNCAALPSGECEGITIRPEQ